MIGRLLRYFEVTYWVATLIVLLPLMATIFAVWSLVDWVAGNKKMRDLDEQAEYLASVQRGEMTVIPDRDSGLRAEPTMDSTYLSLHREVLESYQRAYTRLERNFATLDGKAQATAAAAGLLLAAIFAFLNPRGDLG